MKNYLAEKFRQERLSRNLTLRDVAIGIGYRNINKGLRRLSAIEDGDWGDVDLIKKIIDYFGWDSNEIQHLLDLEHQECQQQSQKWLDEPIEPYAVIKPFCGLYLNLKIPETCKDQASAEQYVLQHSKGIKAWYFISRRVSIYFEDGVRKGQWRQNGQVPRMYLGKSRKHPFIIDVQPKNKNDD